MSNELSTSNTPLAEISQGPSAFDQFLDKNQKSIILLAILIALGAVAFVILRGIEKSTQQTAGNALVKATDAASLQKVIDEFPKTTAAASALLLLGNKQWDENQQDASIATLQKLIAEHPTHPSLPAAQASLASKLLSQGKTADATKLLETLSTSPAGTYLAPFALISLGDIAKAGGDLTAASDYYSKVKSQFPDSPFGQTASTRLGDLKAKVPAEIEPPAPPAPSAPSDSAAPPTAAPTAQTDTVPAPENAAPPEAPAPETPSPTPAPQP